MPKPILTTRVHIYPLSRLVNAPASKWERLIESIEEGKLRAFSYYLPMREGVVLFCARDGKGFDTILADLIRRAREMGGVRGDEIAVDNEAAFRVFVETFYPKIGKFKRDCLREGQDGVAFQGILLLGAPHFIATDRDGQTRYVFLLSAKWSRRDLKAYLALLSVVVEKQYNGTAKQIWCMDLKSGKTIPFTASTRVRNQCADSAKHYARLASVMASE